jgi:hypothetical protein
MMENYLSKNEKELYNEINDIGENYEPMVFYKVITQIVAEFLESGLDTLHDIEILQNRNNQ